VNLTREDGDAVARAFASTFTGEPDARHLVKAQGGQTTLVQVLDARIPAPLQAVKAVVWGQLLERENATCLHRIGDDEIVYVARRGPDAAEVVVHARAVERFHPVERVVVMAYSVDCAAKPAADDAPRDLVVLEGYVLDAVAEGDTRVSWVAEADVGEGEVNDALAAGAALARAIREKCCPESSTPQQWGDLSPWPGADEPQEIVEGGGPRAGATEGGPGSSVLCCAMGSLSMKDLFSF